MNSLVGFFDFTRHLVYCRRCGEGHAPFDRELGVDEIHRITGGLKEALCDFGQRMSSYEEASYMLEKYLNIKVSPTLIQQVCIDVGGKLFEQERKEAEDLYKNQYKAISTVPEHKKQGRIYIEADGSMVLIRKEGYKEVKLGMVFKDSKILNRHKERHIIIEKDYVACLGTAEEFKKMLWAAAIRNSFQDVKEVVILGDGSKWVWNIAKELFPEAVFILDYYHFEEHVYECANVIYPEDEVSRKRWAQEILDGFMEGMVDKTIESINPCLYEDEAVKLKVENLKGYMENNKDKMDYKTYKDKGYFIGSGAVESAHKHVIQQRLKLAGMRWSRQGAQPMCTLRAVSKSDRWDKVQKIIYNKAS